MKRFYSFILAIAIFFLVTGARSARAQEALSDDNPGIQAAFAHLYIVRSDTYLIPNPWWQTSTLIDKSGGVHMAFYTDEAIQYAYCPENCSSVSNWSETPLVGAGGYDSLDYPTLALDGSNRPRMMWYIEPDYYYGECNANCTNATSWTSVKVPVASRFYIYPQSSRYFTLDSQGRPRFVCFGSDYDDDNEYRGFAYTTCNGSCTNAANWQSKLIDLGENMYINEPQIVMNANDQPRIMGINSDVDSIYRLAYLECNANCSQTTNWAYTILYEIGQLGNFSFRLDSQGRPRVAFYNESTSDSNLYFAWSNSTALNPNGWLITGLALPPNDWRTVDLAIDSQDRPRVAFASTKEDLDYDGCTANCDQASGANWQVQHIETADELNVTDPIPAGACIASTWMMDGYPSLALDGADRPSVSYYARHSKMCLGSDGLYHILHDISALRFATGGTDPALGNQKVFLPLTIR